MTAADLFDLTGKVGLVTGANSGLGFGFASGIAKCGGDVVVWGRRADKNEQAAEQLRKMGAGRVHCQSVDVADEAQVVAGMAEAIEAMGRIDGREGVKHMKARADAGDPGGSLIVCGSLTTFMGHAGIAHYAAAKGAMASITRSIAVEYGRDGIRANVVCAGLFYSGLMENAPDEVMEPLKQVMREKNPIPRMGHPEDLEGITAYLMSDSSKYHTGNLIVIDGGQSITTIT
jgi:NAD(P)-dependent dehydrogenase (short-subunit alcohol dehydrogenase family)